MNAFTLSNRCLEDDYYFILGCDDSSSIEQILAEYKCKILLCHPDKNCKADATTQFQKLQEAKEVLCNPEKRVVYDRWKASGVAVTYKQWVSMHKECSTPVFHWAIPKNEGKMLEFNSCINSKSTYQPNELRSNEQSGTTYLKCSILKKFRNYEI